MKDIWKQTEQEKLLNKSFLQQNNENLNKFIERPPLRPLAPNEGIRFMALDIDHYNGKPPSSLVTLRDDKE